MLDNSIKELREEQKYIEEEAGQNLCADYSKLFSLYKDLFEKAMLVLEDVSRGNDFI